MTTTVAFVVAVLCLVAASEVDVFRSYSWAELCASVVVCSPFRNISVVEP